MNKIKLTIIAFLLCLVGCTNIPKQAWTNPIQPKIYLDLHPGDIILKEKELSILGVFGHVGLMKSDRIVVDYPNFGGKVIVNDINYWLELNRKFMVLRYKGMNEEFRKQLISNIDYLIYLSKPYKITLKRTNNSGFYCSQFIWYVYYKTAKDLGFDLDLTPEATTIIFPYDFLRSKKLFLVK